MIKKTLAIFSPNQNAYSETFIQAHKQLPFNIKFYHGGNLPTKLEKGKDLFQFSFSQKIKIRAKKHFSLSEHALINSLKREKVDCVLAEYGPVACETLTVVRFLKLPLIVHFHGYDASVKNVLENYKNIYKEVFNYASSVIVVSTKMKESLIKMGCLREKIIISTYGPHSEFFNNKPKYNNPHFIAVGRFVEKKAPYLTILAFKKVVEQFPNAKLRMIGEGQLMEVCKNLVTGLGLWSSIEFLGIKSTKEIKEIFENSIAFVQHSITAEDGDSEGTPVSVLEAQAAALPVIATYHAGIPDVVINNKTGLLCAEKDVTGMADNMLRILNEKGLANELGEGGRKRIADFFTLEKHLNTLENAIAKSMIP